MREFPNSAHDIKALAKELVQFLRDNIKNTKTRKEWSDQNFRLLRKFSETHELASSPDKDTGEKEFLWDFVGYLQSRGLVIVAESEHDNKTKDRKEFQHDFEKLLYVRSPVKLMLCWAKNINKAEEILTWVKECMPSPDKEPTCTEFSPGEVFILYCTCSDKQDFVYWMQINGEPMHRAIEDEKFTPIPR
jgi:hypothetical protein